MCVLFAINAINFFDRQIGACWPSRSGRSGAQRHPIRLAGDRLYLALRGDGRAAGTAGGSLESDADAGGRCDVLEPDDGRIGPDAQLLATVLVRLGVGVGEATCAPASASLIGDLYPPQQRAKAMSVFMMGLPIGIAL